MVSHSVREAIEKINLTVPDIVLTDLAMPNESGTVLISYIRESKDSLASLPIIVLSACAFQADRENALKAGASIFIPKPFRPAEIVKQVRQLTLDRAMSANELRT